jgi:hypothetical protein
MRKIWLAVMLMAFPPWSAMNSAYGQDFPEIPNANPTPKMTPQELNHAAALQGFKPIYQLDCGNPKKTTIDGVKSIVEQKYIGHNRIKVFEFFNPELSSPLDINKFNSDVCKINIMTEDGEFSVLYAIKVVNDKPYYTAWLVIK